MRFINRSEVFQTSNVRSVVALSISSDKIVTVVQNIIDCIQTCWLSKLNWVLVTGKIVCISRRFCYNAALLMNFHVYYSARR